MRGKDGVYTLSLSDNGITPAYAGKSRKSKSVCTTSQDHPRLCGEKFFRS